jgi:hypothetical protein
MWVLILLARFGMIERCVDGWRSTQCCDLPPSGTDMGGPLGIIGGGRAMSRDAGRRDVISRKVISVVLPVTGELRAPCERVSSPELAGPVISIISPRCKLDPPG